MIPLAAIGLGTQLLGGLFGAFSRNKLAKQQMKMAQQMRASADKAFGQATDSANNNLAVANNMYNGRMAGAVNAEQNIANNAANAYSNLSRNASSGSQLLAAAAGIDAQSNDAAVNLGVQEANNKAQNAGLVMNANQGLQNLMLQKYGADNQQAQQLQYGSDANKFGAGQGFANTGMLFGDALGRLKKGADGKMDWSSMFA